MVKNYCKILGLKEIKTGDKIKFKDGKERIVKNIFYINMAVDRLEFADGYKCFSGEIFKNTFIDIEKE